MKAVETSEPDYISDEFLNHTEKEKKEEGIQAITYEHSIWLCILIIEQMAIGAEFIRKSLTFS